MTIFSFRAECAPDVYQVHEALQGAGTLSKLTLCSVEIDTNRTGKPAMVPDVKVELEANLPLETLRNIMWNVPDGHVMAQTLRQVPLEQNIKDYGLKRDMDLSEPESPEESKGRGVGR